MPDTLADWLAYQERLHPQAIALGLDRVRRVAATLGLLEAPPLTIIVGGTNGKGSSTTLLASIYREAGYRVGAYTSPHLFRYEERIAIDEEPANAAALCRAFAAIEQARADEALTYFEFGTLAALWLFRAAAVDVQVLEVGHGGRLDAVNVLDADAALVTNIGLDHQDWLGEGRDAIGREKAGIYRAGKVAICADPSPPEGLLRAASEAGVQLTRRDRGDYGHGAGAGSWHWQNGVQRWDDLPLPALGGAHQLDNAAGVLSVVAALLPRCPVPDVAIHRALRQLRLPGRMERSGRYLLDVAHNAEAAQALALRLRELDGTPVIWLAGMFQDKPVERMADAMREVVERVVCCDLPGPRGLSADALAARLAAAGMQAEAGGSPESALDLACQRARLGQTILIAGSFLTVAGIAPLLDAHP